MMAANVLYKHCGTKFRYDSASHSPNFLTKRVKRNSLFRFYFKVLYIKPTWCTIFLSMFISFLYMFRATVCPSSGETTVFMRHMVFITLCG